LWVEYVVLLLVGLFWGFYGCIFDRAILLLFQMIVFAVLGRVSYKLLYYIVAIAILV
jgi:hypothetical protein